MSKQRLPGHHWDPGSKGRRAVLFANHEYTNENIMFPAGMSAAKVRRTAMAALGRFKHEGANVVIAGSGHAVSYSGDDERFDYLYKFVSRTSTSRATRPTT
jgi:secreted PhoX family phosphatase